VCAPSALSPAFHADERELAQSGGTLLLDHHDTTDSPGHLRECAGAGSSDSRLPGALQRALHALRLDRDGRCDPRQGQPILPTNFRDTTLADMNNAALDGDPDDGSAVVDAQL